MNDKQEYNVKNGSRYAPIAVAAIGAFLGSFGTVGVYLGTPLGQEIARPDPFTGTQGASLTARVSHLEKDLSGHIGNHPDAINQFDRRIATLEAQYAIILQNQVRIIDRLDKISGN